MQKIYLTLLVIFPSGLPVRLHAETARRECGGNRRRNRAAIGASNRRRSGAALAGACSGALADHWPNTALHLRASAWLLPRPRRLRLHCARLVMMHGNQVCTAYYGY